MAQPSSSSHGIDAAAKQLTHTGTATTQRHYITAPNRGPDVRDVLDRFAVTEPVNAE
ncbi:MAG: hypothetical protein LBG11_00920 [Bifidobacteriaceae bacterium]|nr:hypothetical protein [Bifidobacteriaceae bacterium]